MICPNCNKENAENFRYCQFCGTALTNSAVMKVLEDDEIGNVPESSASTPDPMDSWFANEPENAAQLADRIASEDLPLLDENTASLIPVDISLSGLKISEKSNLPSVAPDRRMASDTDPQQTPPQSPIERICQNCGALVQEGHRFCGNCGSRYEGDLCSGDRNNIASEPSTSGSRASVERMNFVQKYEHTENVVPNTPFTLYHINDDGSEGECIPLFLGENIIGRNSSSILSAERYINPKHMRITCTKDNYTIEDFNSLNGVFYRLSNDSVELHNGDIFRIGEELLCYFHGDSAQPILTNQTGETTELLGGNETPGWGYLRVVMGAYAEGNVYRLWQPTVSLGRTHANILFPKDGFVSGTHATLKGMPDHAILTDHDSSNGTFIRLKAPLTSSETTFILIGNQLLRIQPRCI